MSPGIAAAIWALGLVAWAAIRLPHQSRARRTKVVAHRRSAGERVLLLGAAFGLSVVPAIYVATGFPALADYQFRPWMGWAGAAIETLSLWLFYASHRRLGKNWSITLEIRDSHRLVTDGLYRYIRHPMYSSFWLWGIAQAFLLPNWIAGFAGIVGVAALYFCRIGTEEELMRQSFGDEYRAYAARTGRIIPRIF
jgi:protein-S-isoprenylcysteine O-methyltransferase Ste14